MQKDSPARWSLTKLESILEDAHERLSDVIIESLEYKDFISRYDREGTLFYLDPPYYGNEKDYGLDMFSREEFELMATLLRDIKGTFILSLNDVAKVREIFSGFFIYFVNTTYTLAGAGAQKQVGEVIISNVKLKGLAPIKPTIKRKG